MILAPLQKLPKNVGDLGKFIVAKGFKKLPKLQKIANSGHTDYNLQPKTFQSEISKNIHRHGINEKGLVPSLVSLSFLCYGQPSIRLSV